MTKPKRYNERELIAGFKAGDRKAVQQLFYDHYPLLCQTMQPILGDMTMAEDLAQEVFIKCWRKRETMEIKYSLKAYLRRMAINEALYYLRRKPRENWSETSLSIEKSNIPGPVEQLYERELNEQINAAIAQLPKRRRKIFQLSRERGLTYKQIAQRLSITPKTVENQIGRALQHLRQSLQTA